MKFSVIIPARYGATRLPGKPLVDIAGKPMIQHVYERACESGATEVIVATDDERIAQAVEAFHGRVCMTRADHVSGTDRLAEVVMRLGYDDEAILVNLQGDEPLMPPPLLRQVAENLHAHRAASIATLCERIHDEALFQASAVKVVMDAQGYALYFSRAPIPWARDAFARAPGVLPPDVAHFRHLGLYAYRAGFLRKYATLPVSPVEQAESLEQLRALWHGYKIHCAPACVATLPGVDTVQDLARVRERLTL